MRIVVVRSGGVAGMVTTTTVDTGELVATAADEMRRAVAACTFVAPGEGGGGAVRDGFAYEVVVHGDDGSEQRVRYAQGVSPAGLDDLVRRVEDCPEGRRSLGR